jgi:hypothetical protein
MSSKSPASRRARGCDCTAPKPLDRRIVPDAKYAGMYRIRLRGGGLSDMMSLMRCVDAYEECTAATEISNQATDDLRELRDAIIEERAQKWGSR